MGGEKRVLEEIRDRDRDKGGRGGHVMEEKERENMRMWKIPIDIVIYTKTESYMTHR